MKVRTVAVVLLAVAASVLGAWLCLQGGNPPVPVEPGGSRADAAVNAMPLRTEGASSASAGDSVRTEASPQGGGEGSIPAEKDKHLVLRGTFVVVDERGVEHAHEDGTFALVLWTGDTGAHADVVARAGTWELPVATLPEKVAVDEAKFAERSVFCDIELPVAAANAALALRGRWLSPLTLRVLADDTGADLTSVRIVQCDDWDLRHMEHPGNDVTVVVEAAASPVRFTPPRLQGTQRLLVRAPGYAWGSIDMVPTDAAERLLRLRPGGDIELTITGGVPPEGSVVRVRGVASHTPVAEFPPKRDGATRIDGLCAGNHVIRVEKGLWFHDPLVFGETTVQVGAGTIATATITLRGETKAPPSARAAGTLVVPSTWRSLKGLQIEPTGAIKSWAKQHIDIELAEMSALQAGEYRWDAGQLVVGTWQVLVDGCEYRTRFELGPQGNENVRIVVPDPCVVRVRVLDAETGKALELPADDTPGWYSHSPQWEGGWSHAAMTRQADGSFLCQAPPGTITISAHPEGYSWLHEDYEVVSGTNEFVLQIPRVCGVEIVLKDGDAVIPWPESMSTELLDANGKEAIAYWSGNRTAAKMPSELTLKMDLIPGYEPIAPRKVTVNAGEWTKVEIQLRRKP